MKLSLYYPVKPLHFNQLFGENLNPTYKAMGLPGHNGIDFMAVHGQPIYASHAGMAYYEIDANQGHGVVLLSNEAFELVDGTTSFIKTIYWHMVDSLKEPQFKSPVENKPLGLPVKTGDLLGYADSTGNSTGDHLHYGFKRVAKDEDSGAWYNTSQNNGYMGAEDPKPYFNELFAVDINLGKKVYDLGICKFKDVGNTVKNIQQFLIDKGFSIPVGATGYYGPQTRDAVSSFQHIYNISSTNNGNNVGPLTLAKMQTA